MAQGIRSAQAFTYPNDAPLVVEGQNTAYAIPNGAYFASPGGLEGNAGTMGSPWSLSKGIASVPAGGTLVLRGGDYRLSSTLVIKRKMAIQAFPREKPLLRGDLVVSAWNAEASGRYSTDTTPATGVTYEWPRPASIDSNYTNSTNPMAGDREIVFLNGSPLVQVGTLAEVDAVSFYVDRAADKLYIGQNPAGKTLEVTAAERGLTALRNSADFPDGSVIRGLGFMRFANWGLEIGATGVVVEGCSSSWNGQAGIEIAGQGHRALDMIVRGSIFTSNGRKGLTGSNCSRLIVEGNTLNHNNVERFTTFWDAGGMKIIRMRDLTIRDNILINNYSSAIWMDISIIDAKVLRNFVQYDSTSGIANTSAGIFFEISHRAIIAGNVVVGYGSGIFVSTSTQTRVYNNTLIRNNSAIFVKDDGRLNQPTVDNGVSGGGGLPDGDPLEGGESAGEAALGAVWGSRDTTIKNNLLFNNTPSGKTSLLSAWDTARGEPSTLGVTAMNHNAYYRQNSNAPFALIRWRFTPGNTTDYTNFAAFRAGVPAYEVNGVGLNGGAEPFFVSEPNGNYRLRAYAGNPAAGKGETLPDDIAAALGRPAFPVSIGAFEAAAVPAAPTNLTATAVSSERINLSWTDASSGEGGFKIERSLDGTNFSEIGRVSPNVLTYSDEPLAGSTLYRYRVCAFDVLGNSSYSNLASATTLAAPAPIELPVVADAYVQDADGGGASLANTNYGTVTPLLVKNNGGTNLNRDAYLKFDLNGAASIDSAKLRVWVTLSVGTSVTPQLLSVANSSWIESGAGSITYANRPLPNTSNPLASVPMTGAALAMVEVDVTRYLQVEKAAGRNLVTFCFKIPNVNGTIINITSKEAASNRPVLVVTPFPAGDAAPVAANHLYNATEDQTLVVDAANGVVKGASDADGAAEGTTLTASVVRGAMEGALTLRPNGSFNYTPRANFGGADSFTYTLSDGTYTSSPATVSLTISALNDAPILDLNGNTIGGFFDFYTSFVANRAAVPIAHSTALITDPTENNNIASLSATISNLKNGANEVLAISSGSLSQNYNASTGTLTLSGNAPIGTYQTALRTLTYGNSAPSPDLTTRIINVVVSDGSLSSNVAFASVEMRPVTTLPSPWQNQDVAYKGSEGDNLGIAGKATFSSGTFTLEGAGSGIADKTDGFHFVYQGLSGDGQIVARLASLENTNSQAKAGVMMRESLLISSKNAFLGITPASGAVFQNRTATGSTTTITTHTGISAPRWMKLVRSGDLITGYVSVDGISWTYVNEEAVAMNSTLFVGLGVSSRNLSQLATAVFDNVAVGNLEAASTPVISPNGGTFTDTVRVNLSSLPNSEIYYTLDGTTPTNASTLYMAPFNLTSTQTVSAISIRESFLPSAVASATFTASPSATLSIGAAATIEGASGTRSLVFPLTLSRAVALNVTANFSTSGGTATAGTDYVAATNASVTIPAGQTTGSLSVSIKGDMSVEADETFTLTLSNPVNAALGSATATGTITNDDSAVAGPTGAILSEFRFCGTGGTGDEFIELYNTLATPLNVSGWSIRYQTAAGLQTSTLSDGIVIPARGHYLFTGGAYSLGSYGTGDQLLMGDVLEASGVALFNKQSIQQDAVGFAASSATLREGNGLTNYPTANSEHAFVREYVGAVPKDTVADSSQDFVFVATSGGNVTGLPGNLTPQLGAPSPEGLASPVNANQDFGVTLLDPKALATAIPNRVREGGPSGGTLLLRRTLTNNSTRTITKLRLHITRITSQGSPLVPGLTEATQADVRVMSSTGEASVTTSLGNVRVYGTTLLAPSALGNGALGAGQDFEVSLSTPLLPGATYSYSFLLGVVKSGTYLVAFNLEAL